MLPIRTDAPVRRRPIHRTIFGAAALVAAALTLAIGSPAHADATADLDKFNAAFAKRDWPDVASASARLGKKLARPKDEAERKAILAALTKALRIYDEGGFVALRAAESLGAGGEDGAAAIAKTLRDKRLERKPEYTELRRGLVEALGRTGSVKHVKTLLGYLSHKDARTGRAAAVGLSAFDDAPEKTRKEIAGALVKELKKARAAQAGNRRATSSNNGGERRWDAIGESLLRALESVTGADRMAPDDWPTWLQENKSRKWDDGA